MRLGEEQLATLRAVIDRIVPEDADAGSLALGADAYTIRRLEEAPADAALIEGGIASLARDFANLSDRDKDDVLRGMAETEWFRRLVELTQEGVYADPDNGGNVGAASWRMIGYVSDLPEGPSGPAKRPPQPPRQLGASGNADYDVIVVGAGAGGGVMACRLAEAGRSVLLLERGRELSYAHDGHRDHLRNHRLTTYGHNTGPALEGNPRVFVYADGREHIVPPHHGDYHNNAAGVGSGTAVYGAQAWRFHPDDFRMASRYGVPADSSLADWPFGYDELAPWYDWAEWEIGVAGNSHAPGQSAPRTRDYPMPAVPLYRRGDLLARGAESLGIPTLPVPLLVNTRPYGGRAACIECCSCVGHTCPVDAKNGTQNTVIPRALATGRTKLVTGATVARIVSNNGQASGVEYLAEAADGTIERREARAKAVVLCGGAIESARLLLLSGIGNEHVGRHLQGHTYPIVFGRFDEEVHHMRGPGVSIATTAYAHGNDGVIGGAMLADEFVMTPIIFFKQSLPPSLPRWGQAAKDFMRENYRRVARLNGPVHEIPNSDSRVSLASVTDRFGLPVARLSGQIHEETLRTALFIRDRATDWMRASGAKELWQMPLKRRLSAGQHQAGTCRMGSDPAASATDPYGRVWGTENVYVSDGSLHPTNGAFNPVLTIMALAARNAGHIHDALG